MFELIVTYGSSGQRLARALAKVSKAKLVTTSTREFPDGEICVRVLGCVTGEDVVVVQSMGMRPNHYLVEYCLLVDALRGTGCRSVTGVVPYLAYARQDSRFRHGEPLSFKAVAKMMESAGTDRLITVDTHLHRFKELSEVFSIPSTNISAMPLLAEYYAKRHGAVNAVVVGPDVESEQWAVVVSKALSTDYVILRKSRLGDSEVRITGSVPVKGRTAILVDDIVSTGTTLAEVVKKLRRSGAKRVDALVTHALLTRGALSALRKAGLSRLISTDTIPGPASRVSVAPAIERTLRGLRPLRKSPSRSQ